MFIVDKQQCVMFSTLSRRSVENKAQSFDVRFALYVFYDTTKRRLLWQSHVAAVPAPPPGRRSTG